MRHYLWQQRLRVPSRLLRRLPAQTASGLTRFLPRNQITCSISHSSQRNVASTRIPRTGTSHVGSTPTAERTGVVIVLAVLVATGFSIATSSPAIAEATPDQHENRLIRLAEIHAHDRSAETYWVYRGDRVYDITEWVPNHPGGEVILRAVGGSIEPYWKIFSIHQKQDVFDILEQYFIGKVDPRDLVDGKVPAGSVHDPFQTDPQRDNNLVVHSDRPCNAETSERDLATYITSNDKFYVRNHLWVPEVDDVEQYSFTIELLDGEEIEYSISDLRAKFKEHTVTATMQCSGNRRSHMTQNSRQTNGLQWGVGAIGTAEWTGVKLCDVLESAGLSLTNMSEEIKHLQFVGAESYGASIPISKATDQSGDVLLVYEMNGKPLPRDHGFPLRVLVPGHVAARSVKWLKRIVVSDEESTSQWQRRDYKCFGPNVGSNPDWDTAPAIQETPVQSAITAVRQVRDPDSKVAQVYGIEEESVIVEGYAFAGGGRRIVRVDVSPNNGETWRQAQILDCHEKGNRAWSWRRWQMVIPRHDLRDCICVKAVDESYNTQPDTYAPHYNVRGNLTNAWHRVPIQSVDP